MSTKLKLSSIPDDKPVKLTVELPADVHRDLVAYAEVMGRGSGQSAPEVEPVLTSGLNGRGSQSELPRRPRPAKTVVVLGQPDRTEGKHVLRIA